MRRPEASSRRQAWAERSRAKSRARSPAKPARRGSSATAGGTPGSVLWTCAFLLLSALRAELGMAKPQFGPSNDESAAGRDEQQVYSELKLPIGKPLEDAQSEPRAEQSGWNESARPPSFAGKRRRHALIDPGFILEKSWTFPEVPSPTETSRRNFSFRRH